MPRQGARRRQRGKGKSGAGRRRGVARGPAASRKACALAAWLLPCLALAGCGDAGRELPPEWRGRDLEEPGWANGTLQPGWALGLEYVWPAGAEVRWDWFVEGPGVLHFQVLRVEGGEAQPIRGTFDDESASTLTVIRSGAHQILWRNEGSLDVRFWHQVPEGHGGPRLHSPTEGPDCTFRLGGAPGAALC
jgi:hypothetical protein